MKDLQLNSDEILWKHDKYYVICTKTRNPGEKACYGKYVARCYTLDDKFFANAAVVCKKDGTPVDFKRVEAEGMLVICNSFGNWLNDWKESWRIYDYSGKRLSLANYTKAFLDASGNCVVCEENRHRDYRLNEIIVFSAETGETVSVWYGFREIIVCYGYYVAKDYSNQNWIYSIEGKLVFETPVQNPIRIIGEFLARKRDGGYDVYDCIDGVSFFAETDDIDTYMLDDDYLRERLVYGKSY